MKRFLATTSMVRVKIEESLIDIEEVAGNSTELRRYARQLMTNMDEQIHFVDLRIDQWQTDFEQLLEAYVDAARRGWDRRGLSWRPPALVFDDLLVETRQWVAECEGRLIATK